MNERGLKREWVWTREQLAEPGGFRGHVWMFRLFFDWKRKEKKRKERKGRKPLQVEREKVFIVEGTCR